MNAGGWFSYRAPLGAWEQVCHDLQNLKMLRVQAKRPLLAFKVGAGINNSVLRAHWSTTQEIKEFHTNIKKSVIFPGFDF